ncbi:hypothetical protein ACGFX4_22005 [Kitasatospora sp. NPDC048365]|uniref:hypothetical protein n=1 Tax=Kitasatospora sp. NPDC048365 TaxID=3364050 RepID=UPI00371F6C35
MEPDVLLAGERVLWAGAPRQAGAARRRWARAVPLVLACAGAVGFAVLVLSGPLPGQARLGLSVFAVASLISLMPMVRAVFPGGTESYRITDSRLVAVTGTQVRSWWLDRLPDPVVVGDALSFAPAGAGRHLGPAWPVLGGLADPQAAQRILLDARRDLSARQPVPSPAGVELPPGLTLASGERPLLVARPLRLRWWYGEAEVWAAAAGVVAGVAILLFGTTAPGPFLLFTALLAGFAGLGPTVVVPGRRRRQLTRTHYVVTDRRVLTWAGGVLVRATELARLGPPVVLDGRVLLEPVVPGPTVRRRGSDPLAERGGHSLTGLADPRRVADLVAAAQLADRSVPPPPAPPRSKPEPWATW